MAKWKQTKPKGAATLKTDPKKAQEWQQRSQQAAIARLREKGQKLAPGAGPSGAVLKRSTPRAAPSAQLLNRLPSATSLRVSAPQKREQNRKPRQNDGPWRAECIAARGEFCRCCGRTPVQMDHIKPKGQGGKNDVGNGLPLCEEHHRMKTDSEILIEWAWLDPDQRLYLASIGWVDWDEHGDPFGRGFKHFGTRPSRPGL